MKTQQIWSQFSEALKKFIISKVKDEVIAEDLLQEVFIKIHLHKNNLKKEDRLKSWLFTIANNTINDYFRKHNKTSLEINDNLTEDNEETTDHDAKDCLLPLILNLPKKYREALLLTEIKGFKQAAAAAELKITLTAAKSRVQRGRELLKQGFIHCCDYTLDENGHLKGEHKDINDCKVCD
jgi:RNA polymerase sigma-70 factor (ECF subfamily)